MASAYIRKQNTSVFKAMLQCNFPWCPEWGRVSPGLKIPSLQCIIHSIWQLRTSSDSRRVDPFKFGLERRMAFCLILLIMMLLYPTWNLEWNARYLARAYYKPKGWNEVLTKIQDCWALSSWSLHILLVFYPIWWALGRGWDDLALKTFWRASADGCWYWLLRWTCMHQGGFLHSRGMWVWGDPSGWCMKRNGATWCQKQYRRNWI